ncbi:alpha/beta hydrolase [Mycobacterium aquaticum]|uniref:Esterase n=1 Tax=Mycobacterium aquaticum TaxID=1927124 RepID=A0A1X0A9D7_9MYCO|nr:alpha/beta hydrolase [Mycobacterium aquaticum]ORA26286.1 esterase [Mycobacterium aquaticum]
MTETRPTRPPLDDELALALPMLQELVPRTGPDTLAQVRAILAGLAPETPKPDLTAGGTVLVDELTVPGPEGAPGLSMTVLRPTGGVAPAPVIYHIHGGGMVAGTRHMALDAFVPYVRDLGAVVTSIEYRLAPEHPYPAAVEDCYAGLCWLAENAASVGADPARVMIAGASAGGGLAAATALIARDRGFPALTHQILLSPMLDDRLETPSSRMLASEGLWDSSESEFGWTSLLGERRGAAHVSPYAAPARATDLAALPRTFIDVGSVDGFRDEALIYAMRLSQAGVPVDCHLWDGGFHAFYLIAPQAALSQAAVAARDEFLRRALSA